MRGLVAILAILAACAVEEIPVAEAPPPAPPPKRVRTKAPPVPGLVKAKAKACLAEPTGDELGDEGIAGSRGLDAETVRATMKAFVGNTLSCVPPGTAPNGTVSTEITVACTGLVAEVRVLDGGGLPEDLVACVRETLTYAEFPAHDLPDGYTFGYPVTFTF